MSWSVTSEPSVPALPPPLPPGAYILKAPLIKKKRRNGRRERSFFLPQESKYWKKKSKKFLGGPPLFSRPTRKVGFDKSERVHPVTARCFNLNRPKNAMTLLYNFAITLQFTATPSLVPILFRVFWRQFREEWLILCCVYMFSGKMDIFDWVYPLG